MAGLCPLTEASLGDGIFNGADYLGGRRRFGIGTDSNIQIDAAAELRQLEYGQRLAHRARNVMTRHRRRIDRPAAVRQLRWQAARKRAAAADRRARCWASAPTSCCSTASHPDLASRQGDQWLDAWIFVAGRAVVKTVLVGGEAVVEAGRHRGREAIEARYKSVVAGLLAA